MTSGFTAFIITRTTTAVMVLAVAIIITVVLIYTGTCANIDATRVEIRQQVMNEITAQKIVFPSDQELEAYIQQRMQQELIKRGLEICV